MKLSTKTVSLILVLALVLSIGLVGCGKNEQASKEPEVKTNEKEPANEEKGPSYEEMVKKAPVLKLLTDDSDTAKRDAQVFQQMWEKNLGLKVEIDSTTFKNRLERCEKGDYDFSISLWGPDYNDPMTFMDLWVTGGPFNEAGYSNTQFDELINKAKESADNNERMDLMAEAEKILMEDMPVGPVYFRYRNYIKNPKLKDEVRRAVGADPDFYWASVEGGDSININVGTEPPDMDCQTTTDATSFQLISHLYEGLTRADKDGKPIPGMAKEWKYSDDGLTWTFTLRDDAKWSNGDPVTAKDFEFAWKRALDPEVASQYAFILYYLKNAEAYNTGKIKDANEVGVKAVDEYTLEVTLERPTAYFDSLVTFGTFMPLNQKYYESVKDKYASEANKMIYNGPFTMTEWKHDSKVVLKKNPNYWNKDEIKLDTINCVMVNDANSSLNMFLNGEIDLCGIRGDQKQQVTDKGYELYNYSDGANCYFMFNTKNEFLSNAKIRKALTYAVDRNTYIKNVKQDDCQVALAFVPTVMPGKSGSYREETGDFFKDNDVETAKKMLEEGMKELGLDK